MNLAQTLAALRESLGPDGYLIHFPREELFEYRDVLLEQHAVSFGQFTDREIDAAVGVLG